MINFTGRTSINQLVTQYGKDKTYIDCWDNSVVYPIPDNCSLPHDMYMASVAFYYPEVIVRDNNVYILFAGKEGIIK